ncbi:universal stress protein UspA [Pseudomonas sp. 10B238]|jgi:nucleotide-binding universal stress UspA family protein|uniref:universal stress protein n=1 Tax=Pseudomonadaceae TaxID=135621 RepID=UPI000618124F|nr:MULTISPECIES: universal stress protein [Pseudomonadaceae]MAL34469.1 universal stress protein [Pseudomonas sp.]MBU0813553.1 universal stress protein [Gammaproteobacteria bacterium]KJJ62268.1 universal stress protein UspA [Pseudomonas sp. 10B238]MBK3794436.1 universal stress protein [Stutzerimonas stutzeri]MBK3875926.1 universal stress protein [Stutzerimonas stutzeri]|tara:strand:- start:1182 stop:2033 length:852 start_codon:yes stop_codon:yes gene_type:complete
MNNVLACIDGSPQAAAVCDCAAWASLQLDAPLTLLHVLDQQQYPAAGNLSGIIGLGSREYLLEELAALDEKRSKLALEEGRMMLDSAKQRVVTAGVMQPDVRQRHGDLVESLRELESDTRLLVIGKQGEDSGTDLQLIGSQLESVIRTLHRPILVTPASFSVPNSVMLAFDGSATTRKGVEMLASSPLFKGIPIHLVMVGEDTGDSRALLESARDALTAAGFEVHIAIRAGEVGPTLHAYQAEHGIGLLVMGAYGHSRIRQFLVGSTTTSMIRSTTTPLLLLR